MKPNEVSQQPVQPKPLNYVPNEVCVVVSTRESVPPARLYEMVRATLNPIIASVLETPGGGGKYGTPLDQDLDPTLLRRRHKRGNPQRQVQLLPLRRPTIGDQQPMPPFLQLPLSADETRTLLFYAIQSPPPPGQAESYAGQVGVVRELCLLLNRYALRRTAPDTGDPPFRVRSVGPNWLGIVAPHSCGGPGSAPAPIRPGDERLDTKVDSAAFESMAKAQPASDDVVVVALDTRPSDEDLQRAVTQGLNPRLADVAGHLLKEAALPLPEAYFAGLPEIDPNYNANPDNAQHDFKIPISDHGLFVAGILSGFVPLSNIHVYRVLNRYGMGDLLSLAYTLCNLPQLYLTDRPNRRLVVNLSLFVDVPSGDRKLSRWLPKSYAAPRGLVTRWETACQVLNLLDDSLHDVIEWLVTSYPRQLLIVAAAGNDFRGGPATRPQTRPPAVYEGVLGVGAVNNQAQPSLFSNKADVWPLHNGVAIFGGDAVIDLNNPDGELQVDESGGPRAPVDAVVGIFSAETYPDGTPNTEGLAYWSGTSFATPFTAGIAAQVWAAKPALTADEVMQTVVGFGAPIGDPTDPDGPLDAPTIRLTQV